MGFIIHFYIIFGTNLLTQRPSADCCFCLFQGFTEKEYQTESKWNETFGRIVFGTNATQKTWSTCQGRNDAATRGRACPGGRRAPHPHGPLVAPPTYFFHLYILLYAENIQGSHETTFALPQPSVPVRSHLETFFGNLPEGDSITEGFYINTIAPPMMCK